MERFMYDTPATNVLQVLRKADELISAHGWQQGQAGNRHTGFCVLGAMEYASQAYGWGHYTFCDASEAFLRTADFSSTIPGWNDADERTVEDIHLAFKRAITHLEDELEDK